MDIHLLRAATFREQLVSRTIDDSLAIDDGRLRAIARSLDGFGPGKKIGKRTPQGFRNLQDVRERYVPLSSLNSSEVRTVEAALQRESFL